MSRLSTLIDIMGLGPVWQARDARLVAHPVPSWLAAPETASPAAETVTAEPVEAPMGVPSQEALVSVASEPIAPREAAVAPAAAAPMTADALPSWEALEQAVQTCEGCRLCTTRTQAVFGRGNRHARWLIVGEAPGEQEDRQGLPFVGRAGKLLDNLLAAAGLSPQDDVFIANVLKCRPPGNRNPAGDEIAACQNYLLQQIAHIQPDIIVALGRFAAQTLLQTESSISRLRGRAHDFQGHPLIVSYHPAYLLRNPPDKAKAWQDWVLAKKTLAAR
ncbi:MAG: uracil-DNA glycosylase [Paludibacterium sp.]|uniref:uracil-DNA glycosylase n=1 Tax=Paludibacterium sp. TaxID=1917523 RepID=UPI0025F691A4|nr:uracil-DNA glycosylase [Paludibacterium sp.]MBV8047651.1 uracil-DNA glycosylase [Paludibacterium sp.]MBV8648386.1 uracil-DNA glycosylase [Paludibacterium sp.]